MRRFAWPTDSRPVVEVDGRVRTAIREAALSNETTRLARKQFSQAETWEELCELSAQFCEGRVRATPGHMGPRCEETMQIGDELAHANRKGFLTENSQPGEDEDYGQQRAEVCGWARPETAQQLANLVAGTRLHMQVTKGTPRVTDHSTSVDVGRGTEREDGTRYVYTTGGSVPGRKEIGCDYNRPDLTDDAYWVTIIDPEWGDHRLLFDRLAEPDWDRPSPPAPGADVTTTPIELPPEPIEPGRRTWRVRADMVPVVGRVIGKAITGSSEDVDAELARLDELMREPRRDRPERVHIEPQLGQSDWDNPTPPAETRMSDQAATAPAEPPVGAILETQDDMGPYRIERTDLGWHIQHAGGADEFGNRLTSFGGRGISWRAAWSAWGPPAGAEPFREVPPGTPPLPAPPEEPPPSWVGMGPDASDTRLDPPPPAQPWTPKEPAMPVTETPGETSARSSPHSSSLWWLDGKDTSKMSFNEVTDLAGRAGDLRDEMQRRGDRPERLAEVEREYQRLLEAQQEAGRRMDERRAARADTPAPPTPPTETAVNNAVAGAIQGVSQVTPTGLVAKALSGVTGKNIKPPMASAVDPATNSSTPTGGAGMSKTEEGKQLCEQAKELIAEAQGQTQEQVTKIDEAIAALRAAAEGSDQAEVEAAIARLEQLKEQANEVLRGCGQMPDLIDAIVW